MFDRIDARVETMLDTVAVEEVARLAARTDIAADAPIRRAIGVPAIIDLIAGRADRAATADRIALDTRRYAKRQFTWFRNQPPDSWTRLEDYDSIIGHFEMKLL